MEYAKCFFSVQSSKGRGWHVTLKASLVTKDFQELIEKLAKKNKDIAPIAKKMLKESADITQQAINQSALTHNYSRQMIESEIMPTVEQINDFSFRCKVGFDSNANSNGAMHAIFVNYGTPKRKEHGKVEATYFFTKAIKQTASKRKAIQKKIVEEVAR